MMWLQGEGIPEEDHSLSQDSEIRKGKFGSNFAQIDGSTNEESW